MAEESFVISLSVLYRNAQKYFDHALQAYQIGWGQLIFLFYINENEGCTMQEVTRIGEVDKGTTTKSIQKLKELGYVEVQQDAKDKRIRRLYTTEKAQAMMNVLYGLRNTFRHQVFKDMDGDRFEKEMEQACENSREILPQEESDEIKIGGLQKLTLLDYPDLAASTVFTAGCNFKCPFCHNRDLVFLPEDYEYFDEEKVLAYLQKRQGLLDGVCVSGGEPLLQKGLKPFLQKIRDMGYRIKLDTNGSSPDLLKELAADGLVDYVAMDIKNCRDRYAITCGMNPETFHLEKIEESVQYLLEGHVDYEFRTTVVRELHDLKSLSEAAQWIQGAKRYYLQQFNDSGTLIQEGFTAYDRKEMEVLLEEVRKYVPGAALRGMKGE